MENIKENMAGKWVYLPQKYTAFIPNELPVKALVISQEVLFQLAVTKEALAKFNKQALLKASSRQFAEILLKAFLLKEAIYSSKIEGITTSPVALREADQANSTAAFLTNEVYNNYIALREAFALTEKLPLAQRFFRKTQATLLRSPVKIAWAPGEFRITQNWIGRGKTSLAEALFVPPPAEELGRLLTNLENYINNAEEGEEPLIKAAIIHSQFETLHPFLDGNGRTGRIINAIFLKNNELCDARFLVLSATLYENLEAYYKNLQEVQNFGNWNAWLLFYLKMVQAAAKNSEDLLVCLKGEKNGE